jgi:hypothetical protein
MGEGDVLGRSLTLMFVISSITHNEQIYPKNLMPIGCLVKVPTSYTDTEKALMSPVPV